MATFYMKRNDTGSALSATLKDADRDPVDLSGCSAVFLMARADNHNQLIVNRASADIDADQTNNTGVVTYSWTAADTDETGEFDSEFEVTFPDGTIETFPRPGYIRVVISEDLG